MIETGDNENEYGIGLEVNASDYGTLVGHTGAVLRYTGAVYYVENINAVVVILYGSTGLDEAHVERLIDIAAGE